MPSITNIATTATVKAKTVRLKANYLVILT